jgi:hypothetical protein
MYEAPSILRTLFQVPYPVSLLLATLTKTAGFYTNNSHSGTRSSSLTTVLKFFLFKLLRTLLRSPKTQLFSFQAIPNSFPKTTRGGGYPLHGKDRSRGTIAGGFISSLHPCFITSLAPTSKNGGALPAAMGAAAKRACRLQERRSCRLLCCRQSTWRYCSRRDQRRNQLLRGGGGGAASGAPWNLRNILFLPAVTV